MSSIYVFVLLYLIIRSIIPASAGVGFDFTCSSARGAILVLPDGATCTMSKSSARFIRSIGNVRAWFKHASERDRLTDTLTLVTGHVKCKSWGVAAISNASKSNSTSLKFSLGLAGEGSLSAAHSWQGYSPWMSNAGPRGPSRETNQCAFIIGYKITKQSRLSLRRLLSEVKVMDLKDGRSSYPKLSGSRPQIYSNTSINQSTSPQTGGSSRIAKDDVKESIMGPIWIS